MVLKAPKTAMLILFKALVPNIYFFFVLTILFFDIKRKLCSNISSFR